MAKKNIKGEGELKKKRESLKRRIDYPPKAVQLNKKGQEKQTKEQRKETNERFFKKTMSFSLLLFSRSLQE